MNREDKKAKVESLAEKYMDIRSPEAMAFGVLAMSAYLEGKIAGAREEREKMR